MSVIQHLNPPEYKHILSALVLRVKQAQYNALKAFNTEKVLMAWDFGKLISEQIKAHNWGDGVVANLAKDLQIEFAGVSGFSKRDLQYMRLFYDTYKDNAKVQPLVAQIGWTHNKIILDKCKNPLEAEFYIKKCISNGWSKYDLQRNIIDRLFENSLLAQNNFDKTLTVDEEVKQRVAWEFRDDMGIELINGENPFAEKEIEESIMVNLNAFLLLMEGKFSFVGRQVEIVAGDEKFFVDLLFYHFELNCFVAMELKASKFKPEHLGQIQGYMAIIDKTKRRKGMNPTIGILVCKDKNRILVEYLLEKINQPVGVATFSHKKYADLGKDLKKLLPSEEEIAKRLVSLK